MAQVRTSLFVNVNDLTGNEVFQIFSNSIMIDEFNIKDIVEVYFKRSGIIMSHAPDFVINICPYWLEDLPVELEETINYELLHTNNTNLVTIVSTYYK